jgi:hypothetical protein
MKNYTIAELNAVFTLLSKCKNDKDLKNPSSMLSVIRIIKKIQEALKTHTEEQKEILELFKVPQVEKEGNSFYDWSNMDSDTQSKIQLALNELNTTAYEINGFNKINEEDFVILTQGIDTQSIAFLWDYLVEE